MSCIPHRQVRDAQLGWEGAKKKGPDCPTKAAWHCPADPIRLALGGPQGLGCCVGGLCALLGSQPQELAPSACSMLLEEKNLQKQVSCPWSLGATQWELLRQDAGERQAPCSAPHRTTCTGQAPQQPHGHPASSRATRCPPAPGKSCSVIP